MFLTSLGIFTFVLHIISQTNGSAISNDSDEVVLFDFTKQDTTDGWKEVSDTKREVGMSKAVFTMQTTRLFSRAIFFSLLNPQPNGACFAGVMLPKMYDLSTLKNISLKIRGQGENKNYKIVLHHKGQNQDPFPSYEQFFTVPEDKFDVVSLPLSDFKAYFRGKLVPDAEPLDASNITSIGIQVYGGVYESYKQKGVSSLEIEWIKANN